MWLALIMIKKIVKEGNNQKYGLFLSNQMFQKNIPN